MIDVIKLISINEWLLFCVFLLSILALIISILAYRRSGRSDIKAQNSKLDANQISDVEPIVTRYKSIDVSLMISAKRNAKDQLRLIIKNTGVVTARDIDLIIGEPIRVINKEEVIDGISDTVEMTNPALKPRLTIIDARSLFPITEITPGVEYDLIAVTTMGFGKICDFPISTSWIDDRGTRHFQDEVITI